MKIETYPRFNFLVLNALLWSVFFLLSSMNSYGNNIVIPDENSLELIEEDPEPLLRGTGYHYTPSFLNVTGGGEMPDTTDGIILVADGTGETDATSDIQYYLDSAAQAGKALLIPYTNDYYKISQSLIVNGSVMGYGGMPKIVQTSSADAKLGLILDNGMSGWIYNLHIVGPYDSTVTPTTEYGHNIGIRSVDGVTIMNCVLETALGDGIGTTGSFSGASYNVLISNNHILNSFRNGIANTNVDDHWAIMNNTIEYYSSYVVPINFEPNNDFSRITNMEVGYNDIISPKPEWGPPGHYYSSLISLSGWRDTSPGENFFLHHNWGDWGVDFLWISNHEDGNIYWKNVEALTNIAGDTVPGAGAKLVSVPADLASSPISKTEFNLTWTASIAEAGVKGYLIYQNDSLLGITDGSTYNVSGLIYLTPYEMTVKAYDNEGNTSSSTEALHAIPIDPIGGLNMLINPSIERPLTEGWNLDWGGGSDRSDTLARLGIYSMMLGPGDGGCAQNLQGFKLDSSYTIQTWSKVFGMEEDKSSFGVQVKDSNDVVLFTESVLFPLDSLAWSNSYLTFTVPSSAKTVAIYASQEGSTNQSIIFTDDWSVVPTVPVSGVSLIKTSVSLEEGLVLSLIPKITPDSAVIQDVIWSTSDSAYVTVTQEGFVKAMKEGSAVITVSTVEGGFTASCDITITKPSINYIENPGIETGFDFGWTTDWGGISSVVSYDVHSGSKAMACGPGSGGRNQSGIRLLPGATYTLSAWAKLTGSPVDTTQGSICLDFKNDLGARMNIIPGFLITDSLMWKRYHITFTVPMEAVSSDVFVYQSVSTNKTIILADDFGLVSGWEPLAYVASSDASAKNIFILPGTLSPKFNRFVFNYTAIVPEGTTSVDIRAYVRDFNSTMTGDGLIDVSSGSATAEIIITAEDGITTKTYTIEITVDNSIGILDKKTGGVSLYPNPVSAGNIFYMEGVQGRKNISILDMNGRVMFEQELHGNDKETIQLGKSLQMGTYIVEISGRNGSSTQLLLVK